MTDDTEDEDGEPIHVGRCEPTESVSVGVARALAELLETDTASVELREYVDTEALDRLFERLHSGAPREGRVSFRVADYDVTVRSDGTYTIVPADE